MSPLSIAAMTGVPDKAEESVRSGWGAIFGCGCRRDAKVGHLVGRPHFGKSGQSARAPLACETCRPRGAERLLPTRAGGIMTPGHTRDTRAHGSHRRTSQTSKPTMQPTAVRSRRPTHRGRLKGGHWHSPCHGIGGIFNTRKGKFQYKISIWR